MQFDPLFKKHLSGIHLNEILKSSDVTYFIDHDYCLMGFNNAWKHFAKQNNGNAVLEQYPVGTSIMAALPDQVRKFYWQAYRQALQNHQRFDHDYECSSAQHFRLYHQTVFPLKNNHGLMITNHLVKDEPIALESHALDKLYYNQNGSIVQCCHCRKVQDHSHPEKWDWVPALVEKPHPDINHTFCPHCLDFYYPKDTTVSH